MPPRPLAIYLVAALSGVAAVYVLNKWVQHWWYKDPSNDPPPSQTHPDLPPLRTHALPPPLPNGRALASLGSNPDAMTSSVSLHTLDDTASQASTSDADTEPFIDVLSPPPTHVISRRRSLRNHDLFAASHISFSELGNLVASQSEPH